MSFLSSAFSGASNNFTPAGSQQAIQQAATANQNYGAANTGLNTLAQSLQQQMNGGGPNLANAQLQSATAQNVGNQAALMAGQRGAAANPALIARQAAMQGANIQQQAVGQSAQNVLQQQLSAQQQLGQVLGTQGSLANQNYGTSQGATNQANQIGSQQAGQNAQMNQGLIGGAANAVGSITGLFADGGQVQVGDQSFGNIGQGSNFGFNFTSMKPAANPNSTPQATLDQMNAQIPSGAMDVLDSPKPMMMQAGQSISPGMSANQGGIAMSTPPADPFEWSAQGGMMAQGGMLPFSPINMSSGGKIPAMVSPGEKYLKPDEANAVAMGKVNPNQVGEEIPGKAKVKGDSYANDTVPKTLEEGGVVVKRSIEQSGNPKLVQDFVAKAKRKK
jgi:hypothetical protein